MAKGKKKADSTKPGASSDVEATVNLVGDLLPYPVRDDMEGPTATGLPDEGSSPAKADVAQEHLRGALEAVVFACDEPLTTAELARIVHAPKKEVAHLLADLAKDYGTRGIRLEEIAGGWLFRTHPAFAPFVRDLTKQKPVKLSRAQLETLAILAYRQPITRPEIDDIRGVDSGPVLKLLLDRDLVRILGKKEEAGRPLLYGSTTHFLEFFGLKSLKDLPTLKEFTELSEESQKTYEDELGERYREMHEGGAEEAEGTVETPIAHSDEEPATEPGGDSEAEPEADPEAN